MIKIQPLKVIGKMEAGMGPLLRLILGSGHLLIKRIKNKKLENIITIIVGFLFVLVLVLQIKYEEVIIEYSCV